MKQYPGVFARSKLYVQRSGRWLAGWLALLLLFPSSAAAHPLDEYYQVSYITIYPNRLELGVELYPAVLIAPQLLQLIDADQDEQISEAEQQAYLELFLRDLVFEIDGRPTPLTLNRLEFPTFLDIRAGGSVIRFQLYADLPAGHRGEHHFFYQNNHQPGIGTYVVHAQSDNPDWVQITRHDRDVFQTTLEVDYTIDPNAPVDYGPLEVLTGTATSAGVETPGQARLARYLYSTETSPFFLAAVLGVSIVLGGLHALTPGHGKTLVAAYLIGSRGTIKHAITLGGIVTFTHTISVILIGLLALLASQFIVPNVLAPVLEVLSGLLVVYLGGRLLWVRWAAYRHGEAREHHHHDHHHDHHHPHDHHHSLPESVKLSDLLTLGISGGLVPCPEALGIMLIAIGLNRILLGLGMIVAFSFGLAAILIIIGILLVRSKTFLDRLSGPGARFPALLPLISAVIVTLLGVGIVVKGLAPYFIE